MNACPECGQAVPEPEVVVEEAVDLEPVAEAEVRIAEIQADRDVAVAKIEARVVDDEIVAELAALRAEVEVLRAQAAPAEQEQQEAVVVVAPEPEPEPVAESEPPVVEPSTSDEPKGKKRSSPWW